MEGIVTTATVGLLHEPNPDLTTGSPVDALIPVESAPTVNRALLLRAGALAVYQFAGELTRERVDAPAPAAPETRQACSPEAAALLKELIASNSPTLPEALGRLRRAGQLLPPDLLLDALAVRDDALRAALAPVLGERGRWLSRFNRAWDWVQNTPIESEDPLPADAETIWRAGTSGERRDILRRARVARPALARDWLAAVWKQEKAETRHAFLEYVANNLSAEDEPLLERALDDRAKDVRELAASLLARIPSSAFAARAQARADATLIYTDGKLVVKPPDAFDPTWERDGLVAVAPQGTDEGAFWLSHLLAPVAPAHWTRRFGLEVERLIALVPDFHAWGLGVLSGWARASLLHRDSAWIASLWRWRQRHEQQAHADAAPAEPWSELIGALPHAEVERIAREASVTLDAHDAERFVRALAALRSPWRDAFGDDMLHAVRAFMGSFDPNQHGEAANSWYRALPTIALALPPSRFAAALEPIALPKSSDWRIANLRKQLDAFAELVRLRQRIHETIPLVAAPDTSTIGDNR